MKRVTLLAAFVFAVLTGPSYGYRTLIIGGTANASAQFELGVAPAGSTSITAILSASIIVGDDSLVIRDKLIPEAGVAGVGKRIGPTTNGIYLFHSDAFQYWFRLNSGVWNPIPFDSSDVVQFLPNLNLQERGINGLSGMGVVPTVSTYGLIVLSLAVLVGGSLVIRKRAAER